MIVVKELTTFNGTVVPIYEDNGNYYVKVCSIRPALGYLARGANKCLFDKIINDVKSNLEDAIKYTERTYFINIPVACDVLESFIKINAIRVRKQQYAIALQDKLDFNAKKLLEQFQALDIAELEKASAKVKELPMIDKNNESERVTMAKEITTLTVADIEDIGERAELVRKIFDVSSPAALTAIVKLKSEEIDRELTPLLDLLNQKR